MKKTFLLAAALLLMLSGAFISLSGQTVLVSEDFESVAVGTTPPTGWIRSQATPSYGFQFGNSSGISSRYYFVPDHTRFASSNDDRHDDQSKMRNIASEDRLILPLLDLTPYATTGVAISFDLHNPEQYGSSGWLEASLDSGATWSTVADLPATSSWANATYSLNSLTSSNTVLLAFRHNDGGEWASGVSVDNVEVRSLPPFDAEVTSIQLKDYEQTGIKTISGTLTNRGANTITSLELGYSINGGPYEVDSITGMNLVAGGSFNFTHSKVAGALATGIYEVEVIITNPNGLGSDANTGNDTLRHRFSALSVVPVKKVILQDFTGAWCQFCPDGTVIMNNILASNPNAIGVATHEGDSMEIPDGITMLTDLGVSSYPSGAVDLVKFEDQPEIAMDRGRWTAKVTERESQIVPVSVSIPYQEYDANTRTVTAIVGADFAGNLVDATQPELRLNLWILEDSVTGVGWGYDQVNAFNNQSGHPYFGAGNPIVGFVHDHTLRHMAGGPWGQANSVPDPISAGYSASQTFTYILPPHMDEKHIKLVGIIQQYDTDPLQRPILNSEEVKLQTTVSLDPAGEAGSSIQIYPNPFRERAYLEFQLPDRGVVSVEVYDLMGKRVTTLASGFMGAGAHSVVWDGSTAAGVPAGNGVYSVVLSHQGKRAVRKVILQR